MSVGTLNTQAAHGYHSGLGQDERGRRLRPKLDQACTAYRAGGAVAAAAARTGQARGELSGRAGELLTYLLTYYRRCWCPLPGRVSAAGFPDHLITSREFSVSVEMVVTYFASKPCLSDRGYPRVRRGLRPHFPPCSGGPGDARPRDCRRTRASPCAQVPSHHAIVPETSPLTERQPVS